MAKPATDTKSRLPRPSGRAAAKAFYRRTIIEATIKTIARHGFAGVSVSRLMHYSGLSRGMVNLHFKNKETLLLEVLRHLADNYRHSWRQAHSAAGPRAQDRLMAIVDHDIERGSLDRDWLAAWLGFRREAISQPAYRSYCDPREADFHRAVLKACRELRAEGGYPVRAQDAALAILYLLEGMWIDCALDARRFRKDAARRLSLHTLHGLFPKHFAAPRAS